MISDLGDASSLRCDVCAEAKMRKVPMPALAKRDVSIKPGAVMHVDIKGPLPEGIDLGVEGCVAAYNNVTMALVCVDEATRYTVVQPLVEKTAASIVNALSNAVDEYARHNVVFGPTSNIHSDSEGVFDSKRVKKFLAERRMSSTQSPPHAHERNGIAERTIQTLFDTVRALLGQAAIPQSYY